MAMEGEAASYSVIQNLNEGYNNDPLSLQASDHPGMCLTNIKLNGTNFQQWSRSVKIALRTITKIGFIEGTCERPASTSPKYEQWIRCDNMVVSWLLNSIVPELSEAFLYAGSAKELWSELAERFGQSNGPLLYQIQKEIAELHQGNDSIAVYYTKLKRLWDELDNLSEIPSCDCIHKANCGASKRSRELDQQQRLMHFLMKLNDGYDSIRGQILLMDPLPNVNKAYCMIARVETQRLVTGSQSHLYKEIAAMSTKVSGMSNGEAEQYTNALAVKGGFNAKNRRDSKRLKNSKFCDHCQKAGHTQDQCFKLIGYPDWYEGTKEAGKGRRAPRASAIANMASQAGPMSDSPLEECSTQQNNTQIDSNLVQALAQEMLKLMKGSSEQQASRPQSYAHFAGMAKSKSYPTTHSSIECLVKNSYYGSWIVDTGASDHMTHNLSFLDNVQPLAKSVHITLPDGTIKRVSQVGQVRLCPNLTLDNVLYVPNFKFNLISVHKLLTDMHLFAVFTPYLCKFQDLSTNLTVACAPVDNGLYQFKSNDQAEALSGLHFSSKSGQSKDGSSQAVACPNSNSNFSSTSVNCKNPSLDIIHARLGHTSFSKMQHIPSCIQHLSDTFTCDVCVQAKMHRLPFNKSSIHTSFPFQLIHLDVWGPYKVANICGAHYFLTIVDDLSLIHI